ncbi:uncharacterized protein FN964_006716 isoform 2-T4 [Alca torda]
MIGHNTNHSGELLHTVGLCFNKSQRCFVTEARVSNFNCLCREELIYPRKIHNENSEGCEDTPFCKDHELCGIWILLETLRTSAPNLGGLQSSISVLPSCFPRGPVLEKYLCINDLNFLSHSFSLQICSSFSPPDDQTFVVGNILASCLFRKCLIPAAPATAFSIKINFLTRVIFSHRSNEGLRFKAEVLALKKMWRRLKVWGETQHQELAEELGTCQRRVEPLKF